MSEITSTKPGCYVIMKCDGSDYFKTVDNRLKTFPTEEEARLHCGIYELEDVMILLIVQVYE